MDIRQNIFLFGISLDEIKNRINELETIADLQGQSILSKIYLDRNSYLKTVRTTCLQSNNPKMLEKFVLIENRLKVGKL